MKVKGTLGLDRVKGKYPGVEQGERVGQHTAVVFFYRITSRGRWHRAWAENQTLHWAELHVHLFGYGDMLP